MNPFEFTYPNQKKSIMKKSLLGTIYVAALMVCTMMVAVAQNITTPRAASPAAKASQTIGISKITVKYSRPAVRGRQVYGTNLAHYGYINLGFGTATAAPWRAGANENTTITFSDDAKVQGESIPAGTYGLFIGLHEDGKADIIFSRNTSSWGSFFYSQDEDQLRVTVESEEIPNQERLTFDFVNIDATSAIVVLDWEKKRFPFKVEFDVNEIVLANARDELRSVTGFGWQGPASAARYCLQNNINHEEAMAWADQAIAQNRNFQTVFVKAGLMAQAGQDASATYNEAASLANINQLNALGYQLIGQGNNELALSFFRLNVKNNPDDPNVHDSLGECLKTMGQNKEAIKEFKKSLSLNPPANVKTNSIKHLKELGVDTSSYEVD
jgi:tetratricopeptide (TPR) repeat protein